MKSARRLVAVLVASMAAVAGAVEVDGVAAQVGTTAILRSDVADAMRRRGIDDSSRFEEVRNDLVERTLILKAAAESKMSMQEWVVEDRIKSIIADAFNGDRNKLVDTLSREKVTYSDWRRRIKEDLIVNAMKWNVVYKNVKASPSLMKAEFKAHPERYRADDTVSVSVILLDPAHAEARADVAELIKTNSFAAAARKYSVDSHAQQGGLWKDVKPAEVFKTQICDEIAKMPVGTVSDWVEIEGWSFLLKKESESASRPRTFAEAYADIESHVREAEAKRLYDAWMERLKAETYIRIY